MLLEILDYINYVFYGLLGLSVFLLGYKVLYHVYGLMPSRKFPDAKKNHSYAIIIPARYESNVIEALLVSIKNQDYPKELLHTYVIVESEKDPTCEICKRYPNTEVFVRPNLDKKSKGGALDQIFQKILVEKKGFEAYFVFDADNILMPTYISEMNKTYDAGYKMALAYRNSKNWNDGWVAACSGVMFSMINTFQNKARSRFNSNVVVSGTGFYIAHDVIENLGGWKFFTLTEDYEISLYAALNNIKSTYNEYAEFYDEQPKSLKASWNQRIRWVKGFHQSKGLKKQLMKSALIDKDNRWSKLEFGFNVIPILVPIISIVCYIIVTLGLSLFGWINGMTGYDTAASGAFLALIGIYLFFAAYTLSIIMAERKHIDIKFWNAVQAVVMGPLYFALYVPLYFIALFKKEVKWKRIDHDVNNETLIKGK